MKEMLIIMIVSVLIGCCASQSITKSSQTDYSDDLVSPFQSHWYAQHLRAADETPIDSTTEEHLEIYRFLWLRTFHHPLVIRVTRTHDQMTLVGKQLNGAGGYEPGEIDLNITKPITLDQWEHFETLLTTTHFWEMPSKEPQKVAQDGTILVMLDGAHWILEGLKNGQYHFVDRQMIMDYPDFQNACLFLLSLSEIPVAKEEIY